VYLHQPEDPRLPNLIARGNVALAETERHLAAQPFFVGDALTIADIALFAYTHKAHEGGFDLAPYPALRAWLARCLAVPGMSEMPGR
jgi:glutathione S-transferase